MNFKNFKLRESREPVLEQPVPSLCPHWETEEKGRPIQDHRDCNLLLDLLIEAWSRWHLLVPGSQDGVYMLVRTK
jgi:hypothetical protein